MIAEIGSLSAGYGRIGPNSATEPDPTTASGSPATTSLRGRSPTRDGVDGCAPSHSSACGSPSGSRPSSAGMKSVVPQA